MSAQALLDDVRDAFAHLIFGQRRSLRTRFGITRPYVHGQSLVLRDVHWQSLIMRGLGRLGRTPEKSFQQSVWANLPVLRAQNDLGRICQKKLRHSVPACVPRSFLLSLPIAHRV